MDQDQVASCQAPVMAAYTAGQVLPLCSLRHLQNENSLGKLAARHLLAMRTPELDCIISCCNNDTSCRSKAALVCTVCQLSLPQAAVAQP